MVKIGLDLGTGFVKCVSDYGRFRFPSLYVKRIHGVWTDSVSEAIGYKALHLLGTRGAAATSPIRKGRPDTRHQKQIEMLIHEAINRVYHTMQNNAQKARIVVGLPYEAADCKGTISRLIGKMDRVEKCDIVAQAAGTLVDMDLSAGIIVSIGQGTSEIVLVEDNRVIDGESSEWASEFVTRKIGKFAHLDTKSLVQHKAVCAKYAKILAENLAPQISDMSESHGGGHRIVLSGGGILIPKVREELVSRLKGFKTAIPDDPVMSNASGLYKLVG